MPAIEMNFTSTDDVVCDRASSAAVAGDEVALD
jgi:hypothetical protein